MNDSRKLMQKMNCKLKENERRKTFETKLIVNGMHFTANWLDGGRKRSLECISSSPVLKVQWSFNMIIYK